MLQNSIIVFNRITIMFLLMLVGFFFFKRDILDNHTTKKLSVILNTYIMPCCVMEAFQRPFDRVLAKTLGITFLLAAVLFAISIVLAFLLFPKYKPDSRVCSVLSNNGFMALPLLDAMFGSTGVFLGSAHIVCSAVVLWTFAVSQLDRSYRFNARRILLSPGVLAAFFSLLLFVSPVKLPAQIFAAVGFLGDLNTPLAMLVLGAYLAQIDFRQVFTKPDVWKVSFIRILLNPLISVLVLALVPLDMTAKLTLLVGAAAPTAIAAAMFAQIFETDYLFSTRVIALSTLFSLITLPVWIAVLTALIEFL